MTRETTMGGASRSFSPTLWTVVLKARAPGGPEAREALDQLFRAYWKPIYGFIRRSGISPDPAKDLTQEFFTYVLEENVLRHVGREKGRFRTFLLAVLKHFLSDEAERATSQKRGGGRLKLSLDFADAENELRWEPSTQASPEHFFKRQWATETKPEYVDTLRSYLMGIDSASPVGYREVAQKLGISESTFTKYLHRARVRFRELLQKEIRTYVATEKDVQEEIQEILGVLLG